jgi:hypothetical protein
MMLRPSETDARGDRRRRGRGAYATRPAAAPAISKHFIAISLSATMRKCQRERCGNVPPRDNDAILSF